LVLEAILAFFSTLLEQLASLSKFPRVKPRPDLGDDERLLSFQMIIRSRGGTVLGSARCQTSRAFSPD
jgi:hypothetical protein